MSGDAAIDKAMLKIKEAESKNQELFEAINKALSWVPDMYSHLIEPIQKGCEEINKANQRVWELLTAPIREPGNPGALREASEKWTSEVSQVLGTISGDLNLDNHKTKVEWEGRAAEAYKGLVPEQVEGVNGLKSVSDHMVSSLDDLANTIVTFWVAIGVAIVTFIVGLAAAIAACVGIVTIPAAIAALLGVIAVCVGLLTAAITAIVSACQSISSSAESTKKETDELGKTWEKSDAGVDYGEESNWEPQA